MTILRVAVRLALVTTALVPLLGAPLPAAGQVPAPNWGTDATHTLTLHAMGFVPEQSVMNWTFYITTSGVHRMLETGSPSGCFDHTLELPSGSQVTAMALDGCDDNPDSNINLTVGIRRDGRGPSGGSGFPLGGSTTGSPGCQSFLFTSTPFGIDNEGNAYFAQVCVPGYATNTSVGFKAVRIYYNLQVSPAPASATFGDVPTDYWAFRHIEALAASGITAGCGGGNYCPEEPLNRAQMAVFLAKALGLHWAP